MGSWFDCNNVPFSQGHVLLVIAYGEQGERLESSRAVAARRDRAPPKSHYPNQGTGSSEGHTDLLMPLREVHEEYCERIRGCKGLRRASSNVESTYFLFINHNSIQIHTVN